jgi:hypothetical protein
MRLQIVVDGERHVVGLRDLLRKSQRKNEQEEGTAGRRKMD